MYSLVLILTSDNSLNSETARNFKLGEHRHEHQYVILNFKLNGLKQSIYNPLIQVENAVTSLAHNYSKAINDKGGDNEASFQLVSGLSTVFLERIKGPDALYKVVVSLATLIVTHEEVKDLAVALDVDRALKLIPKNRMTRLDQIVSECLKLL